MKLTRKENQLEQRNYYKKEITGRYIWVKDKKTRTTK